MLVQRSCVLALITAALIVAVAAPAAARQDPAAPRILLDQPLRAVEYQLSRLTDDQLTLVERSDDDARYRPVFMALLLRKGVAKAFRDEAVAALVKLDKSTPAVVLIEALGKVPEDDALSAGRLAQMLLALPADALRAQRGVFTKAIDDSATTAPALRGAYGALLVADGQGDPAWQLARKHDGHLAALLGSLPALPQTPAFDPLRAQLFTPVAALAAEAGDDVTRTAAYDAIGWTRRDAGTFQFLATSVSRGAGAGAPAGPLDASSRAAAIRSLQLIPPAVWPAAEVEPLAKVIVAIVAATPADERTEPAAIDAIQLGEKLAAALPDDRGRAIRRDLRALGVQVVRIETVFEQMIYDVKWFVVEAGKPVQIVLVNNDAMSHNLLVGKPGSLETIGTAGAAVPVSADPTVKPFVPDTPLVLQATRLLLGGETERLGFTAPTEPGEYIYVCTFPGHWVRMYGVMLVVPSLEAWEAKPTVPTDPLTGKPFTERKTLGKGGNGGD